MRFRARFRLVGSVPVAAMCWLVGCSPGPEVHTYTTRTPYLKARIFDAIDWPDRLVVRQVAVTYLERVGTETKTTYRGETTSEKYVEWDVTKANQVLDWMSLHLSSNNWGSMLTSYSGNPWLIVSKTIELNGAGKGAEKSHETGWLTAKEQVSFTSDVWQEIINAAYYSLGTSRVVKTVNPILYGIGTVDRERIAGGYVGVPGDGALEYRLKGRPEFTTTAIRYSPVGLTELGILKFILPGVGGLMLSLCLTVIRLLRPWNSA